MNRLIALHGLSGETAASLAAASVKNFQMNPNVDESLMAVLGGGIAGLLGGLAADLATGGMSLGGGAIAGMVLGGGTTYALAKGYNLAQAGRNRVRWSDALFLEQVKSILLLYLAVAHFGRGRGAWKDPVNNPAKWQELVNREVDSTAGKWKSSWKRGADDPPPAGLKDDLATRFHEAAAGVLARLYPESRALLERRRTPSRREG